MGIVGESASEWISRGIVKDLGKVLQKGVKTENPEIISFFKEKYISHI